MATNSDQEGGSVGGECSLIDAIHAKYSEEDLQGGFQVYISKNAPGRKDSGTIELPSILALDNNKVTYSGSCEAIASMCGHVTELDLTNNTVTCWKEVLKMVSHMVRLHTLNLTSNPLRNETLASNYEGQTFPNITLLILNNTKTYWDSLHCLLKVFPNLSELHLSLNGYRNVDVGDLDHYPSLTRLYINKHAMSKWTEIRKLGQIFPQLETLVNIESNLSDMIAENHATSFPCLKCLHISKTMLLDWEHIEELRKFPKLFDVRMKSIPFLEEYDEKVRRQMIIARLPNITHLNGSRVQETEREDAERALIRYYMDEEQKPNRYYELEEKYGKLDPLAEVDLSPQVICRVKVIFDESEKEEMMDIDVRQTIRELKKLFQNFAGIPSSKFRLWYVEMYEGSQRSTLELLVPDKHVYQLHVRDGDQFLIVPKFTR